VSHGNPHEPALEIEHVSVSFGARRVIDDVSASFARGVTTAVVGRSGAGKSVLLKAACGLLPHAASMSGTVRVHAPPLVFVHQDPALLDDLDVLENVAFGVARSGIAASEVSRRVNEALHVLDLHSVRDLPPARLPLATQKRVAIARALALTPAILVLDEPTTGLDPLAADTVDQALAAIAASRAMTLIVITHSPRTLEALRPRIVVIDAGHARPPPHAEART
jgi:ABC-type multidrug transport system ATPase subunit